MANKMKLMILFLMGLLLIIILCTQIAFAQDDAQADLKVIEETTGQSATQSTQLLAKAQVPLTASSFSDPLKYTLGPDDVIEITVMRHTEFSGTFPVNLEGKIQLKFAGDIEVTGLTKKQLEAKIKNVIGAYIISPEVTVTILEYKSKVIYVLGEVGQPGKFYMRSESIPVREAVVQAGLPTLSAAMRRCRLITPDTNGKPKIKTVDLYSILYGGQLQHNVDMHPGDVLYVPATVMAKIIRVINPVTSTVGLASSGPNDVSTTKKAITTFK